MRKFKASILVVSLMVMGIILVTALGIAVVSVTQRNSSIGSNKSIQAYQLAESGSEYMLQKIRDNSGKQISAIDNIDGICDGVYHSANGYTVTLEDQTGAAITDCTRSVADIVNIKSIGSNRGEQRAIEAAVASSSTFKKICSAINVYPNNVSPTDTWRDSIPVSDDWTNVNCQKFAISICQVSTACTYQIGCYTAPSGSNNPIVLGSAGNYTTLAGIPSTNCGW